jgi:hypothetical protein
MKASRFNSYQSFCSGHSEASHLIRKIQNQYPAEWETFERQSSSLVSDTFDPAFETSKSVHLESGFRGHTPDLNGSRTAPPKSFKSERRHSLPSALNPKDNGPRLVCMDYLIKPVQRICRYPLLLDQLKTRKTGWREHPREGQKTSNGTHFRRRRKGSDVNVIVESASQAMRHVASSVDEANRRQSISVQSSLIVSRILMASSSVGSPERAAFHNFTPMFLSSLGACVLAGSFDVMHYHSSKSPSTAKPKYLGAFLYMGGYIIMVKVCKGKVYEPRHWFSLDNVDLTDLPDEDGVYQTCIFLC